MVVHSRDDEEVGVAHKAPKTSLNFPRQQWAGKTKPKQAFRWTRNAFKKLSQNFNYLNFLLTD